MAKKVGKPADVYGTQKLAHIFGVAPRTVAKWIDTGRLAGWRIPGSLTRRVSRADAIAFAVKYRIPVAEFGLRFSDAAPPLEVVSPPDDEPPDPPIAAHAAAA